ncbi:MAG: alanine--tRNA ligase [Firmicutes bacterium]|nr:alanine--tRNA ligase [Bacillota bacterium]
MKYMGVNELREKFLKFWETKDHLRHASYSLIPENDKSLLLIAAGMAPLKPYFSGAQVPPRKRMTTAQKCIRTNDIDNVGHTARHATFFEMMGNFSFGDYFKEGAINWGWEFITSPEWLDIPKEKVWATIYEDDDEAYNIWREQVGMPAERIVRLGKEDNFWEIGTGPCGPCSEVYFDRGPEYGCGKPDCKPGCDCDRYMEFWNFVFTQFDRQEDGTYLPLAHPNIDTGMGLERMACIMQGVDSIYNIDTMHEILQEVCRLSGVKYQDGAAPTDVSLRIITDHVRTVSFMIGDGILPSNEGRGYILRRLLRRAARHGRLLGIKGAFINDIAEKVFEQYGEAYPELIERKDYIRRIISIEEEKFDQTIESGMSVLEGYMADAKAEGKTQLSGEQVFKLYDTYGFPIELTQEIAEEQGYTVDEEGFRAKMQAQKDQARAARKAEDNEGWLDESVMFKDYPATEFTGYESLAMDAKVLGLVRGMNALKSAGEGEEVRIVLDRTPFYAEGGGQVGDTGVIEADGFTAAVTDTIKVGSVYVHKAVVTAGEVAAGDTVTACVDALRRHAIARNHTATHLLQKALRTVLGDHVEQAGSLVNENELRFDFTHFEGISAEDLARVEDIVNTEILKFTDVETKEMPIEEAKKLGAMMLFGEKYGETVRVVNVPDFSMEFCGGTHVANIGQIGCLHIVSESGVAAGTRRIVAVTGSAVNTMLAEEQARIAAAAASLKTNASGLEKRAEDIAAELKAVKKELEELKAKAAQEGAGDLLKEAKLFGEARLIEHTFEGAGIDQLRSLSDQIKAAEKNVVMVFAAVNGEKATLMVSVTDDLTEKGYHAGSMIKEIAKAAGGGGGGKADMAQAGAKDLSKLPDAFAKAEELMAAKAK